MIRNAKVGERVKWKNRYSRRKMNGDKVIGLLPNDVTTGRIVGVIPKIRRVRPVVIGVDVIIVQVDQPGFGKFPFKPGELERADTPATHQDRESGAPK